MSDRYPAHDVSHALAKTKRGRCVSQISVAADDYPSLVDAMTLRSS